MKQTNIYLLILLLFAALVAWVIMKDDKKSTLRFGEAEFAIENSKNIHKIILSNRSNERIELQKTGDTWQLNGKYKARPTAMNNILEVFEKVRIQYKPSKELISTMVRDLAGNGILVQVFDKNNEKIKGFYVGGVTPDERGTYMIMENSEMPYVTYIPEWEGGLRVRFFMKEEDWRDRTIFAYQPENIQQIAIEYPNNKQESFVIEQKSAGLDIKPFYSQIPTFPKKPNTALIKGYLVAFEKVGAESFENSLIGKDSIAQLTAFSIIHIKDDKGQEQTLRLHPLPKLDTDGKVVIDSRGQAIIERYLAFANSGDVFLVQDQVFRNILRGYSLFF